MGSEFVAESQESKNASWTTDRVLALAPDPASAKSGKSLATLNKWGVLGQDRQAIWGECQGSGKDPYLQTRAGLTPTDGISADSS
jgi:hypothetical protein